MKRSLFLRSKKSNIFMDTMLVVFVLIGVGIFSILGYIVFSSLNDDIQSDSDMDTQAKEISSSLFARYPQIIDGGFVFIFILLWVFVLVSSSMIDSHPMFFVIALILMIFTLVVTMLLGNATGELLLDGDIAAVMPMFPVMNWFLNNLVLIVVVIGGSILLVLYGKNKFM